MMVDGASGNGDRDRDGDGVDAQVSSGRGGDDDIWSSWGWMLGRST